MASLHWLRFGNTLEEQSSHRARARSSAGRQAEWRVTSSGRESRSDLRASPARSARCLS
jgi:hypothetical protein